MFDLWVRRLGFGDHLTLSTQHFRRPATSQLSLFGSP
jgi:hypothetical protein